MKTVHHFNAAIKLDRSFNHRRPIIDEPFTLICGTVRSCRNRARFLYCCRLIPLLVLLCISAGCVERPKGQASGDALAERRVDPSAMSRAEAQAIKREAFNQLQPLIRRFDRKKVAYMISEQQYLEKLYLWTLTFGMLELRSNPGTFAGDLPEHEMFPFSDFAESAENVLGDLTIFLNRFGADSDPELKMLLRRKEEASAAVQLTFPGTGSRLQDAIVAMRTPEFQALVNISNPRIASLSMIGGKQVVDTLGVAAGKAINLFNAFLKSTSR